MSREDMVFTRRAIVVVAVVSVLLSNAAGGFMAAMWLGDVGEKIEAKTTKAATSAALSASREMFHALAEKQAGTTAKIEAIDARLGRVEDRVYVRSAP